MRTPGVSPNLKGSAPTVSSRALNALSPLCLPISSPGQGGRDSTIGAVRRTRRRAALKWSPSKTDPPMKNDRIAPLALLLLAMPLLVGGCALYKNPSACETRMRSELAQVSPQTRLKISRVGVGIGGSRVVVEGTLKGPTAASDVSAASNTSATASAPPPKTRNRPAALECTFNGDALVSTHWLAPTEMAKPASTDDDESNNG